MLKRKDPEFRNMQTWVQSLAQSVPQASYLTALTSKFSMVWKRYAFSRNCTSNSEFWWAHPLVMRAVAVSSKKPQPHQPHSHEGLTTESLRSILAPDNCPGLTFFTVSETGDTPHLFGLCGRRFSPAAGSRKCSEHTEGRPTALTRLVD